MDVSSIALGALDSAGATVEAVYAKNPPIYAVYRTKDRVMVHYADDDPLKSQSDQLKSTQRLVLSALNPLRGEINGLVDGWRASEKPEFQARARCFDRRVADAIILALEGDVTSACALLQTIKNDAKEERVSWARFAYLLVASAAVVATIAVICFLTSTWFGKAIHTFPTESQSLWLAGAAGSVGAFFSIAIAIRSRTILPDLRMRDNAADGVLRVVIGVIAAVLLVGLVQTRVVTLTIGVISLATSSATLVAIIGFTAGFLERLVPDLLAKSALASGAAPSPPRPAPDTRPGRAMEARVSNASDSTAVARDPDGDGVEDITDACLCDDDKKVGEAEATPDSELPVAVGGVAREPDR